MYKIVRHKKLIKKRQWDQSKANRFEMDYCGAKGSRDFDPFHIKPKTHTEEEEVPEDEWRESRLSGYAAEDNLVLGRPKSQEGKMPHRQR